MAAMNRKSNVSFDPARRNAPMHSEHGTRLRSAGDVVLRDPERSELRMATRPVLAAG